MGRPAPTSGSNLAGVSKNSNHATPSTMVVPSQRSSYRLEPLIMWQNDLILLHSERSYNPSKGRQIFVACSLVGGCGWSSGLTAGGRNLHQLRSAYPPPVAPVKLGNQTVQSRSVAHFFGKQVRKIVPVRRSGLPGKLYPIDATALIYEMGEMVRKLHTIIARGKLAVVCTLGGHWDRKGGSLP